MSKAGKGFKCGECGVYFLRKYKLNTHMKIHRRAKPFRCNICKEDCLYKSQFVIHMRRHNGEKPYSCSVCEKAFICKSYLAKHMRNYGCGNYYSCKYCEHTFPHKAALITHLSIHSKEKIYHCSIPTSSFSTFSSLSSPSSPSKKFQSGSLTVGYEREIQLEQLSHILQNSEKKSTNLIDECKARYYLRSNCALVNEGKSTTFIEKKKFSCEFCKENYLTRYSLIHHKIKHAVVKLYRCRVSVESEKIDASCEDGKQEKYMNLITFPHSKINKRHFTDNKTLGTANKEVEYKGDMYEKCAFEIKEIFCEGDFEIKYEIQDGNDFAIVEVKIDDYNGPSVEDLDFFQALHSAS